MGEPPELLVTRSVTWLRVPGDGRTARRFTVFLARAAAEYQPVPDPGAVAAWAWLTRGEAGRLSPLHPSFAAGLAGLLGPGDGGGR